MSKAGYLSYRYSTALIPYMMISPSSVEKYEFDSTVYVANNFLLRIL